MKMLIITLLYFNFFKYFFYSCIYFSLCLHKFLIYLFILLFVLLYICKFISFFRCILFLWHFHDSTPPGLICLTHIHMDWENFGAGQSLSLIRYEIWQTSSAKESLTATCLLQSSGSSIGG